MRRLLSTLLLVVPCAIACRAVSAQSPPAPGPADPERGAIVFRQCVACHALAPGIHLSGPSLAGIYGRKAGTIEGFVRYSDALRRSGLVWTEGALDRWLENSQAVVPGNLMTFPGIAAGGERADVIAYLKAVATGRRAPDPEAPGGGRNRPDLKQIGREFRVKAIRYCGDTYFIGTEAGETFPYWEYNLRFKTDGTDKGPAKGTPVLLPTGMQGDRAFVVFSTPEEISGRIERKCQP